MTSEEIDSIKICGDNVERESILKKAEKLVEDLYSFRDHYYENKEISDKISSQKVIDVKNKMDETVKELKNYSWDKNDKCYYHLYVGKSLNVVAEYCHECQENLSKAIKLNPKLSEAWFQLGECHWKNNDVEGAYNCFKSALEHQTDKHILRSMSMVLRQLPSTPQEKKDRISESIKKAKEALKLDMTDGKSWTVLGSAYLNSFLCNPFNSKFMNHALTSYQKAIKDPIAYTDPDLHYNYGIALLYESQFSQALEEWCVSARLDYTWKFPKDSINQTLSFLDILKLSMINKGKMKEKRFRQLISSLKEPKSRLRDLGPYCDGKLGNSIEMKRVSFEELKIGSNSNTMVLTKVVCGAMQGDKLAHTVIVVDETGHLLPMRMFNMAQSKGPVIGDSIAIPEPFIESIDVSSTVIQQAVEEVARNPSIYKYDENLSNELKESGIVQNVIRISIPSILVVNGRKVNDKWTALPVVQNLYFTDNWLSSLN